MPNAARLSGVGTFFAFEFDDNTKTSFSVSAGSTSFSNEFDENTSTTISGAQRMSATSGGGLIVLDSINEVDSFDNIPTSNLELHLDATSGFMRLQQSFTSTGTTTFTVPTGVTQVSAVCVGGGGGGAGSDDDPNSAGGGGGLSYGTFTVTPGETLTVTVGAGGAGGTGDTNVGGNGGAGGNTTIARGSTILLNGGGGQGGIEDDETSAGGVGGTSTGTERDGGGTGGRGGGPAVSSAAGGGGAAGYSGNGGAGGANGNGSAGAGGGGGGGNARGDNDNFNGQGGGGVGILGEGSNGAVGGGGGSGGGDARGSNQVLGGIYGGGGGGANEDSSDDGSAGSQGAARIIWGSGRSYPSTNVKDNFSWKDISGNNRHARISPDTSVSLLLNGNGSNNSTTITDSSTYNHSITVNGDALISTAQSKFGGSSIFFTGYCELPGFCDYVRAANSSEFAFGTGDFTVEAWLRGKGPFFETRTSLTGAGFGYAVDHTSNTIKVYDGQGGSHVYTGSTTYNWTNWHHVAISRSGTTLRVFVDGSLDGTATTSRNLTQQGGIVGANINTVLASNTGSSHYDGYIDDLRVTKGVARYTSAFTPPEFELSAYDDPWDPYNSNNPSASTTNPSIYYNLINFTNTIEVGQTVVIPEIQAITGIMTNTYELYNLPGEGSVNSGGNVLYNSVTQSPVVGPIGVTIGTREFFRFGGSVGGIQNTTLRIPPQQVPYTAVKTIHENNGSFTFPVSPVTSSSIDNERASALNVPFKYPLFRLGVCDGAGASAYTGVTGTAARTIIVGVKVPASPSTSHTIFSYGANVTGQRFNIRLQSTGHIRIPFGGSYVQIPVSAIDDRSDFLVIAVTVPASATVSDVRVWLNGNEVTSQLNVNNGSTSINTSSANNVTIGGGSHGTVEYLDDSVITKVMMYSTVLSDLEIKQIYQSIIPDIYPFVERAS